MILSHFAYDMRTYDDAFITYRYARNISNGLGFVYNPPQQVLGTSTPLFTLLLAGAGKIIQTESLPQFSYLLNLVVEAVNAVLLFRISNRIFGSSALAGLISIAYIFQPVRLDVVSGGMETPLYITLLLLMYHDFILGEMKWTSAVWAGLAFLIRPDSIIASLPVFILWFFRDRRSFLKAVLLFCLIITPWLLFSLFYFGHLLPNTILAKSIAYRNPAGHALLFLATFYATGTLNIYLPVLWLVLGFVTGISAVVVGSFKLSKSKRLIAAWLSFPFLFSLLMSIQNPAMWFPWYYLPLIPIGILSVASAAWFSTETLRAWRWLTIGILIALIPGIPLTINHFNPSWDPDRQREAVYWEACQEVKPEIQAGDTVLAPDIGVIGWCLDQAKILDPIGLVSPEALPYQQALSPNQWISPDLIRDFQPEYIIAFEYYLDHAYETSSVIEDDYLLIWQKVISIQSEDRRLLILKRIQQTDLALLAPRTITSRVDGPNFQRPKITPGFYFQQIPPYWVPEQTC